MLSCCKCVFEWIGANLAHIRPKNLQNVRKIRFRQKSVRFNRLICFYVQLYGYKVAPPLLSKGLGNLRERGFEGHFCTFFLVGNK